MTGAALLAGDALELSEVVEVVAGHGFHDGLEGHGSALGMGDGAIGRGGQGALKQDQVPLAESGEGGACLGRLDALVGPGPVVLVEGLDRGRVFRKGLAQAEAEYKDFILFYPNMEESAESQFKVCNIHYKQMDKADRDNGQAQRAEDECRLALQSYPNSKFVPQVQQMLRNTQEVLADKEFLTGQFYSEKGSYPAAANRLYAVVGHSRGAGRPGNSDDLSAAFL